MTDQVFVPGGPPSQPPPDGGNAAVDVAAPAIGLIVTAILGFAGQGLSLVLILAGVGLSAAAGAGPSQGPEQLMAMLQGGLGIVSAIVGLIMSAVILIGALKMKKLESYGFAMASAIIAMVPCISPCCLVGLPIGIWALVVLLKPEVKAAFRQ